MCLKICLLPTAAVCHVLHARGLVAPSSKARGPSIDTILVPSQCHEMGLYRFLRLKKQFKKVIFETCPIYYIIMKSTPFHLGGTFDRPLIFSQQKNST